MLAYQFDGRPLAAFVGTVEMGGVGKRGRCSGGAALPVLRQCLQYSSVVDVRVGNRESARCVEREVIPRLLAGAVQVSSDDVTI